VFEQPQVARIYVLAGVNGAGKSSVGGAMLAETGVDFFNPDSAARRFLSLQPGMSQTEANSTAWQEGRRLLERAINERLDFAFETTLGGNTMASLLEIALSQGMEVRIWYVGLQGENLHISRVRSRVAKGGHDIQEAKIRERYVRSRAKLIELLPKLTELKVFDNSEEGDPQSGKAPAPKLLLHMKQGKIAVLYDLHSVPPWAKPILQVAIQLNERPEI
jgi:predicted ABC-type ATPase